LFPALTATKSTPGGSTAYVNEPFTWQVNVMNGLAAGIAYNVGAVDTLPANWTYTGPAQVSVNNASPVDVEPSVSTSGGVSTLTWTDLGTLPASASVVITYQATPTAAATVTPGAGLSVDHRNSVLPTGTDATGATGNIAGPGSYSGPAATAVAHIASADVQVVKQVGAAPVAGGTGSWTLTVSNQGPDPATGPFTVTDAFDNPPPAGVTAVGASGSGWSCTAAPIVCQRTSAADTLASGAAFAPITITYSMAPNVAGGTALTNSATVAAHTFDPDLTNNTGTANTTVSALADVGIVKTLGTTPLTAGRNASYAIAVTNYGPSV
jgi:fimbrial isopeptide formation D2 family protein/uncharacterized repeat protein (TIGR01451 family)